jgi:hypothetical protein
MADTQSIVLGSDSGTFWREGDAWTDDPSEAKSFDNPREAWQQAVRLQSSQADYRLSGISVLAEYSLVLVGYDHSGLAILILIALKAKRTRH